MSVGVSFLILVCAALRYDVATRDEKHAAVCDSVDSVRNRKCGFQVIS